jgi:hypothetical protein
MKIAKRAIFKRLWLGAHKGFRSEAFVACGTIGLYSMRDVAVVGFQFRAADVIRYRSQQATSGLG